MPPAAVVQFIELAYARTRGSIGVCDAKERDEIGGGAALLRGACTIRNVCGV